jgi:hypothetical protein
MKSEVILILRSRLYKGFWFGWAGFFVLFFLVGVFLQNLSISKAIFSSFIGSLIGSSLYILVMKLVLDQLVRKFEEDAEKYKILESRFEDYAEVGNSLFNKISGKVIVTNDKLIFKPINSRIQPTQALKEFILSEIENIHRDKDLFGRNIVVITFMGEKYTILTLGSPNDFMDSLKNYSK